MSDLDSDVSLRETSTREAGKKPANRDTSGAHVHKLYLNGVGSLALGLLTAAGNIAGFVARYWKPIALVALALLIMGVLRGCHFPFVGDIGKSRGEIILERDLAIRGAEIASKFGDARVEITRSFDNTASSIARDLAAGTDELENLRDAETLLFLTGWASADRRLCNNAGPCGNPGA